MCEDNSVTPIIVIGAEPWVSGKYLNVEASAHILWSEVFSNWLP